MGDAEPEPPLPESMLTNLSSGVRLDRSGSPLRHTVIGLPREFEAERRARLDAARADGLPLDGSSLAYLELPTQGSAAFFGASDRPASVASRSAAAPRAPAWLSEEEREAVRQGRVVQRAQFYRREHTRNAEAAERATGKASIMYSVGEHRDKVIGLQAQAARSRGREMKAESWAMHLRGGEQGSVRSGGVLSGLHMISRPTEATVRARPPPALLAGMSSLPPRAQTAAAARAPPAADVEPLGEVGEGGARAAPPAARTVEGSAAPAVAVELSSELLALDAQVGEPCSASVTLRNRGSCAAHFSWRRVPAERQQRLHAQLPTHADAARFHVAPALGALVPGAELVATFTFSASVPGRFAEAFELLLNPPDARRAAADGPATVRLVAQCAEPVNAAALGRSRVQATVARSVVHSMVLDILTTDVLARIPQPRPPVRVVRGGTAGVEERERAARWAQANAGHALHYEPAHARELRAIEAALRPAQEGAEAEGAGVVQLYANLSALPPPAAATARAELQPPAPLAELLGPRLDALYAEASMPPLLEARQALSSVVYASLCELADEIEASARAIESRGEPRSEPTGGEGEAAEERAGGAEARGPAPTSATAEAAAEPAGEGALDEVVELADTGWAVDTDWVGTRAVQLPAAALVLALRQGAPVGESWAQPRPPEPVRPAKRTFTPQGGAPVALMPSPFLPARAPPAPGALASSSPWAARLSAPGQRASAAEASGELALAVRELLLGLASKIATQVGQPPARLQAGSRGGGAASPAPAPPSRPPARAYPSAAAAHPARRTSPAPHPLAARRPRSCRRSAWTPIPSSLRLGRR